MALELVGGADSKPGADRFGAGVEVAEAERLVAGARQRLEDLADALAALRRKLVAAQGHGDGGSPSVAGEGAGPGTPRGL